MTVLVDAEPQQDEMDIFVPAQLNQFQRLGEIIFSLAFFHLNPVHRSLKEIAAVLKDSIDLFFQHFRQTGG